MRRAELVAPVAAILAALALSALLLLLLGANPVDALGALVKGAFGDRLALENTLVRMAPLLLIGAGISIAFRCGVWNIGGEGQLYAGALVATWVATTVNGSTNT